MTPEEMDRAIAEYLGWEFIPCHDVGFRGAVGESWRDPDGDIGPFPPAYSADLNAMHEAEHSLKHESSTWNAYCENLTSVCSGGHPFRHNNIVAARACHRAEAFLRTVGKYSDATHPLP